MRRLLLALLFVGAAVAVALADPFIPQRFTGAQLHDATLDAWAGATCSATKLLYCSGTDQVTSATLTTAGLALLDDAAASDQRTTLGLGTAAVAAAADFQAAGVGTYPALTWDYTWTAADGDPLTHGWGQGTDRSATTALVTTGICAAHNCYSVTPGAPSSPAHGSFIKYSATAATGSWELHMRVGTNTTSAVDLGFGYNPGATASGTKLPFWGMQTAGLAWWNGSMSAMGSYGSFVGQLLDITVRCYNSGAGATFNWLEVWVGPALVDSRVGTTNWQAQTVAGDIVAGRLATDASGQIVYLSDVQLKWSGINVAPPSYTYSGQAYPL